VEGQLYPLIIASILGCINNEPSNSALPLSLIAKDLSLTATTSGNSGRGYNALHWAAAFQNIAVIRAILKQNPRLVHVPTDSPAGEFPLNIAARQSNSKGLLRTLQTLVEADADPTAESKEHGLAPLGSFVAEQSAVSKANRFIASHSKSNPWTALHLATDLAASFTILDNFGPLNLLRHLLQFEEIRGLLEVRTREGYTPVLLAAIHANYATARVLGEAGADTTAMSNQGSTCMSLLLRQSRHPLTQLARLFGHEMERRELPCKVAPYCVPCRYVRIGTAPE
jgi:ankyrin repeat protein